jgi:hypothetical protein
VCATYCVHQPSAPYRYSASFPWHPHWHPCQDQALRRAMDEVQRRRHIAVDYTSCAEAAGRVAVCGGGSGTGAVEGRHWD